MFTQFLHTGAEKLMCQILALGEMLYTVDALGHGTRQQPSHATLAGWEEPREHAGSARRSPA